MKCSSIILILFFATISSCNKPTDDLKTDDNLFVKIVDNSQTYDIQLKNTSVTLASITYLNGGINPSIFGFYIIDNSNSARPFGLLVSSQSKNATSSGLGEYSFGNTPAGSAYAVSYSNGTDGYISDLTAISFPSTTAGKILISKIDNNIIEGTFSLNLKLAINIIQNKTINGSFRLRF